LPEPTKLHKFRACEGTLYRSGGSILSLVRARSSGPSSARRSTGIGANTDMGSKFKVAGLLALGAVAGALTTMQLQATARNSLAALPLDDIQRLTDVFQRIKDDYVVPVDEKKWPAIVEYCSFDWMKRHATQSVPLGGAFWDAGAEVFINKGVNGRWADTLTPEEVAEYEARAERELGAECARWLATGQGLD